MAKFVITMRTADRTPKPNYVGGTVARLIAQGIPAADIHVFPTSPNVRWLLRELGGMPVTLHTPQQERTPNENGLAQVSALDSVDADWILLLEDDLEFCDDVMGSIERWLDVHARKRIEVYRLFAFGHPVATFPERFEFPLTEMRGSQAVVLRKDSARDLVAYVTANPYTWRPSKAPFQKERKKGFDKMIGYWALARFPHIHVNYVTRPFFVRHIGDESSLHRIGIRCDHWFAGHDYRYPMEQSA